MNPRPPLGIRLNNPGNLEKGASWLGLVAPKHKRFCTFATPQLGIRALAKVLLTYQRKHGIRTIRSAISRFAPPGENNTNAYITHVCSIVGRGPDDPFDFSIPLVLVKLVDAIIRHENANYAYPVEIILEGVNLALGN